LTGGGRQARNGDGLAGLARTGRRHGRYASVTRRTLNLEKKKTRSDAEHQLSSASSNAARDGRFYAARRRCDLGWPSGKRSLLGRVCSRGNSIQKKKSFLAGQAVGDQRRFGPRRLRVPRGRPKGSLRTVRDLIRGPLQRLGWRVSRLSKSVPRSWTGPLARQGQRDALAEKGATHGATSTRVRGMHVTRFVSAGPVTSVRWVVNPHFAGATSVGSAPIALGVGVWANHVRARQEPKASACRERRGRRGQGSFHVDPTLILIVRHSRRQF